jgi:hypothetical protein
MQIVPKNLVNWLVQYKLVGFQQAALPQEALSSKYGIPFNVLLYWMKVGWLYEKAIEKINHICIKRKVF